MNDKVYYLYQKIKNDIINDNYDVVILYNGDLEGIVGYTDKAMFSIWDTDSLNKKGYQMINKSLFPGSCHFPLLNYYLSNSNYDYYWFIEYDVWFTGNWSTLVYDCDGNLRDYDFLSSHIESFNLNNSSWGWWYKYNNSGYNYNQCIKGFNPICRYSSNALKFIDKYQRKGYYAHSEVLITTCLFHNGFKIGNFGGISQFTPIDYRNKFYIQGNGVNNGTIRWRPIYKFSEIEESNLMNCIFHPLK